MQEILMTPQVCMQFLIWSCFYHDIIPEKELSYTNSRKFSDDDARHLDELKNMLFKCFEEESVLSACHQLQLAKVRNEPCPYTQKQLDSMFAHEI